MYGKLFSQMYDGTLATKGPWQALVTFQQLIILADKDGVVDMTPEVISRRTTIPLEIIQIGLEALEQPDNGSRTIDLEGRRITRLSEHRNWGWHIVNYSKYAGIRTQDERREYMKMYQRARRADVNKMLTPVNKVTHIDVDVDVDTEVQEHLVVATATPPATKPPSTRKNLGARLPSNWSLPDDWKDWALATRQDWTPHGVVRESITFRDYWLAKAGKDACKVDWLATWRTWIRRAEMEPRL